MHSSNHLFTIFNSSAAVRNELLKWFLFICLSRQEKRGYICYFSVTTRDKIEEHERFYWWKFGDKLNSSEGSALTVKSRLLLSNDRIALHGGT